MKPRFVMVCLAWVGVFLLSTGFFLWQQRSAGELHDFQTQNTPARVAGTRTPSLRFDRDASAVPEPAVPEQPSPQGPSDTATAQPIVSEASAGPAEVGDVPVILTMRSTPGDSVPAAILVNNSSDRSAASARCCSVIVANE